MKTTNTGVDICNQKRIFENKYGIIQEGTMVSFMVENQDQWRGDLKGELIYEEAEFKIRTEHSGKITINHGYDAYFNSINPI